MYDLFKGIQFYKGNVTNDSFFIKGNQQLILQTLTGSSK